MIKRIWIVLALLGLAAGLAGSTALAGPPWPADVVQIREGEFCTFLWFSDDFQIVYLPGTGMWTAQYLNGHVQWNCHAVLDFTDPNIASTEEVCALVNSLGLDMCNGNGSFVWKQTSI